MTRVFLSPSSQERNLGIVPGYVEEDVCNRIADVVQRELTRQGTYDTMRNNPYEQYYQHTARSNDWGADLHIAIHTNASSGTARGLNAGCANPSDPAAESTKLTRAIFNQLSPLTPASDKMVKYTFNEVVATHCPAAYLEISFHDNPDDANWILSHIEEIGVGIAAGIVAYENKIWIPAVVTPPIVVPPVVDAPTSPPQPATGVLVGGTYSIAITGNTSADGKGEAYTAMSISGKCIKILEGSAYPYGMDLKGGGWVTAWFAASAIR